MKWGLLAGLLAVAACTAPRPNLAPPGPESEATPERGEGFSLVLNNRHYLDVNVFVHHDGQASRVATVTGSSSTAMAVPGWMIGKSGVIRLIAELVGDLSSYTTESLVIQPGQMVELNVESAIGRSNYSVR